MSRAADQLIAVLLLVVAMHVNYIQASTQLSIYLFYLFICVCLCCVYLSIFYSIGTIFKQHRTFVSIELFWVAINKRCWVCVLLSHITTHTTHRERQYCFSTRSLFSCNVLNVWSNSSLVSNKARIFRSISRELCNTFITHQWSTQWIDTTSPVEAWCTLACKSAICNRFVLNSSCACYVSN